MPPSKKDKRRSLTPIGKKENLSEVFLKQSKDDIALETGKKRHSSKRLSSKKKTQRNRNSLPTGTIEEGKVVLSLLQTKTETKKESEIAKNFRKEKTEHQGSNPSIFQPPLVEGSNLYTVKENNTKSKRSSMQGYNSDVNFAFASFKGM